QPHGRSPWPGPSARAGAVAGGKPRLRRARRHASPLSRGLTQQFPDLFFPHRPPLLPYLSFTLLFVRFPHGNVARPGRHRGGGHRSRRPAAPAHLPGRRRPPLPAGILRLRDRARPPRRRPRPARRGRLRGGLTQLSRRAALRPTLLRGMPPVMAPLPTYAPMLAQPGSLPSADQDAWAVEMKWDGVRALAYIADGTVRLMSRNAKDITAAYPELQLMAGATGRRQAVVDGEIVAFDEAGRPSCGALQPRMHQRNPAAAAELAHAVPVTFMAFDLLHLGDDPLIRLPYTERRDLLETVFTPGYRWQVPVRFHDHAEEAFASSRRLGLEGVVCKRLTSPYRPGRRTAEWTKVKNVSAAEVVIGGRKPAAARRPGTSRSLPPRAYGRAGPPLFIGHLGTRFTQALPRDLHRRLAPLERPDPPFDEPVPREHARGAHWVEPVVVGEVQYAEITGDHRLRHPSWRGLRPDRHPGEVRHSGPGSPGSASAAG